MVLSTRVSESVGIGRRERLGRTRVGCYAYRIVVLRHPVEVLRRGDAGNVHAVGLEGGRGLVGGRGVLVLELRWVAMADFGCADFAPGTEFGVCSFEDCVGFFWKFDFPAFGEHAENAEGAAGAEPAFCNLFEVLDAVDDVTFRVLLREVE